MQRILSVETSRSTDNFGSEFVTKRLCCSFLFVIAFFSVLGGFMLGRYAADKTITNKNANIRLVHDKVVLLYGRFSHTFQGVRGECSCNQTAIRMKCNFTEDADTVEGYSSVDILNILIDCFGSW